MTTRRYLLRHVAAEEQEAIHHRVIRDHERILRGHERRLHGRAGRQRAPSWPRYGGSWRIALSKAVFVALTIRRAFEYRRCWREGQTRH